MIKSIFSIIAAVMISWAPLFARDGHPVLRLVQRAREYSADLSFAESSAARITGTVVDENSRPLPYSMVRVKGKRIGVMADSLGRFYLSMRGVANEDTVSISYLGYKTDCMLAGGLSSGEDYRFKLTPSVAMLQEVVVMPDGEASRVKKGKKHGWGWMKGFVGGETKGEGWGYEFHSKKGKRLVLDKVGFYYCEGDSQMTNMRFRVNVYDMGEVTGSESDRFVNVLSRPIYFDFTLGDKRSGRFEYRLSEPVVLPRDAMVEIEFLENLGSEKLYYKCNLVGRQSWGKYATDPYWFKHPFASPFFVECLEVDAPE